MESAYNPTILLINKILDDQTLEPLLMSGLSDEEFGPFEKNIKYIKDYHTQFDKTPSKSTFRQQFPTFELINVKEDTDYIINQVHEQQLTDKLIQVVSEANKILSGDTVNPASDALTFMREQLLRERTSHIIGKTDITKSAQERLEIVRKKNDGSYKPFISTGLIELDDVIGGYQRGEELVIIVARTGNLKSAFLVKTTMEAWREGETVGFISPEMSPERIGYRFDTAYKNFSNRGLIRGLMEDYYAEYIDELSQSETPFYVSTPEDFGGAISVSKLRQYVKENGITMLAIDGSICLYDETSSRGATEAQINANIGRDLMRLSVEEGIPIILVVQALQRVEGAEEVPELRHIRGGDGWSHNATKVIAMRKVGNAMELAIKKHRDGEAEGMVKYEVYPDTGKYIYLPDEFDSVSKELKQKAQEDLQNQFTESEIPF